jgi:NADH:ubiquinone oxidoreductase subunit K
MIQLEWVLVLGAVLFALGLYGVLARRNAVMILLAVELMLNAVNINMVAFAVYLDPGAMVGLIFAIFIITVAAAEVGLALAIVLRLYRNRRSVNLDEVNLLKW